MVTNKHTNEIAEIIKETIDLTRCNQVIIGLAVDLSKYFKKVNPEFFNEKDFLKRCGVEETEEEWETILGEEHRVDYPNKNKTAGAEK